MIEVTCGDGPMAPDLPHAGTELPRGIAARLNDRGMALSDTCGHIHRLYKGMPEDVTTVRTPIHRYAIDGNRPRRRELLSRPEHHRAVPADRFRRTSDLSRRPGAGRR